ncbi:Fujikurins efflux protein [Lachnellula hyalina]|uniref:Fujikurins efflux protein n=1 Tax=Lachnellula hyalina TaxID=1316788 RepID=A0A8H8R2J3_9HELO|nr:Fujikurins efflux protein [Lachnellula hyalina]TVY26496.1 Fujikurins efflux protein [Lachnellula hyalina]
MNKEAEGDCDSPSHHQAQVQQVHPPDQGWRAWQAVVGAWCCLFASFGWINALGIFQDYYEKILLRESSASAIAWITSIQTFILFLMAPVCGKLYDNYGPRYLQLLGTLLQVFGLMMASLSTQYYQLLLFQGICASLGASLVFHSGLLTASTWFKTRRGLALGIVASGSSIGGMVFPILLSRLLTDVGFGWTMRICAFVVLGVLIIANVTVQARLIPEPKPVVMREFVKPFGEKVFLLLTAGTMLGFLSLYIPLNYIVVYAQANSMSTNLSTYLPTILNAASLFGRILPGWLGDHLGLFNIMVGMSFLCGLTLLPLWILAHTNISIVSFAALYGFASGAFVSLVPGMVAQISEKDMSKVGVRQGSLFACISISCLVGTPIGGALLACAKGGFWAQQVFAGVMMFAGCLCYVSARLSIKTAVMEKV